MTLSLEQRVEILEAKEAIGAIMSRYLMLVDEQAGGDPIAELFTEDAVWTPKGMLATENRVVEGRETLRDLFDQVPEMLPFTVHYIMNPEIHVDIEQGTATGEWQALEFMTGVAGEQRESIGLVAIYRNTFKRVSGSWLIDRIVYEDRVSFPWGEGWTDSRYVSMVDLGVTRHE